MKLRLLKTLGAAAVTAAAFSLAGAAAAATISKNSGATAANFQDFPTTWVNHPNKVGYGSNSRDGVFLETFKLSCPNGGRVASLKFEASLTKLTQGANRGDNDGMAFWDNQTAIFNTFLWKASDAPGTTKQVSLDLANLPTNPALGVIASPAAGNALSTLADNDLSVSVQDDTRVNAIEVTYECSGGRVATDAGPVVSLPGNIPRGNPVDTMPVPATFSHTITHGTLSHTVTHGTQTATLCCPEFTKAYPQGFVRNMFTEGTHTSGTGLSQTFSGTSANSVALANNLKNWANWLAVDGCPAVAGFRITYSLYNTGGTVKPTSATLPFGSTLLSGSPQSVTYMNGVVSPTAFTWNVPASPNWWFIQVSVVTVNAQGQPVQCSKARPCMNNLYSGFIDDATGMKLAPGAARPTRWAD
jgi:hypothetical protein